MTDSLHFQVRYSLLVFQSDKTQRRPGRSRNGSKRSVDKTRCSESRTEEQTLSSWINSHKLPSRKAITCVNTDIHCNAPWQLISLCVRQCLFMCVCARETGRDKELSLCRTWYVYPIEACMQHSQTNSNELLLRCAQCVGLICTSWAPFYFILNNETVYHEKPQALFQLKDREKQRALLQTNW